MNAATPKPGRYQPKCKSCQRPFRLVVSDEDPPRVAVKKLATAKAKSVGSEAKPSSATASVTAGSSAAASGSVSSRASASSGPAAKPRVAGKSSAGTATVPQNVVGTSPTATSLTKDGDVDATIDPGPSSSKIEAAMPPGPSRTAMDATMDPASGDVDATMDSAASATADGSENATMDGSVASQTAGSTSSAMVRRSAAGSASVSPGQSASGSVSRSASGSVSRSASVSVGRSASVSVGRSASVSAGASASVRSGASAGPKRADANSGGSGLPARLGGYRIISELGRGAMGAVYEAKQISLDRPVALKTIRDSLARNASSLARFTREAYAAAQMTHHNVVQIYDFGEDSGRHFFSMEWVRGGPLSDVVREKGQLDARLAASYTLQAARGLQLAHRNGMVHRDIKPANLLLTDEGVVKVADLGLVKIQDLPEVQADDGSGATSALSSAASGTDMTMHGTAIGTPAYMAPEQATDASTADHRADIYSLGCTLYFLLTGKPPYPGSQISEVMDGHLHGEIPDVRVINPRTPAALADVIEKCLAKSPDERYETLAEMIEPLETFLDVRSEGGFSPTSEQADRWEAIAKSYASKSTPLRLATPLTLALVAVAAVLLLATPLLGWSWLLLGPTLPVTAIAVAIGCGVLMAPGPLATRVREYFASLTWFSKTLAVIAPLAIAAIAIATGLWPGWLVGGVLGAIAGAGFHFALVAPVQKAVGPIVVEAERFVRDLRLTGADDSKIRDFCARYGGKTWRGLFQRVFGDDSAMQFRERLDADPTFNGSTALSMSDRVCMRLRQRTEANRQLRDEAKLAKVEQRGLRAEGLSASEAAERAAEMAAAVVDAAKMQSSSDSPSSDDRAEVEAKRARMKAMLAEARSGRYKRKRDPLAPIKFVLGGQTRLAGGLLLLTVFAIWGNAAGLFESFKAIDVSQITSGDAALSQLSDAATQAATAASEATGPIGDAGVVPPQPKRGNMGLFSIGIAGLLLALSAFVSGWRMTPFAIVATLAILFGPLLGVPDLAGVPAWVLAAGIGVLIYVPGVLFGESKPKDEFAS